MKLTKEKALWLILYVGITLALEFLILFITQNNTYLQRWYLPVSGLKLDWFGFILPGAISLVCLTVIICLVAMKKSKDIFTKLDIIFLALWIIAIAISFFIQTVNITKYGAGFSIPLLTLAPLIIGWQLVKDDNFALLFPLAWVIGFAVGACSDFISTFGINPLANGIWGGLGLFDLDVLLPFILVLSVFIIFILKSFKTNRIQV